MILQNRFFFHKCIIDPRLHLTFFRFFLPIFMAGWLENAKINATYMLFVLEGIKIAYLLSANSFRGNYTFLNLALCMVPR